MKYSNDAQKYLRSSLMTAVAGMLALAVAGTAGAQPPTPPAGAVDSTPPKQAPGRASWTADRRDFAVGDIITVLIDDYTISSAVKDNIASDQRNRNLGVTIRIPNQGSRSGGIDSRNDAGQQQRGQQRRENRFQNEMSVRVVAVGDNGLLQIRGTKLIDVDKAKQDIVFTGFVRSQDVSSQNLVESYRVADAQLAYASPGPLGKPKQGILSRILGMVWP